MRTTHVPMVALCLLAGAVGCENGDGRVSSTSSGGSSSTGGATVGTGGQNGGTGGAGSGGQNTRGTGGGASTGGATETGGQLATGGRSATGGQVIPGGQTATGGHVTTGGQREGSTGGSGQTGGTPATGGQASTGGQTGGSGPTGGTTGTGGSQADAGQPGGCVPTKTWGTLDPSVAGPFEVVVEKNVGPAAGVKDAKWNNEIPHFNVYRPKDMSQGYCHPVITWGNGTGDQPEPNPPLCLASDWCGNYKVLITQLASHGFVVVASLSSQTAQGNPLPQVAGANWMIEENENPSSALYHRLDIAHIGATGHSQGGAATTMSGADSHITAITPICGSRANITLHGPALLLCGGADTTVPCSSVQSAFDSIKDVPVMMAEIAGVTHGSWIGSIKDPIMVGTTAWMRVHLMNDTANRGMFYGPNCKVCSDPKWKVQRKLMDP